MIYLITGVPGSGKSLYAVSTLLQKLLAEKVKREDGSEIPRRLCVDGIPSLVIDHEMMAPRPEVPRFADAGGKVEMTPEGHGIWNWYEWCQPGDVIVCDEVQRHWRPRGMGVKPPPEIAMLETHRHKGVDFVLITQNAMLLDQNVRRLVGRHLHVRRIFGGARALIYDWDGCQTDTTRTAGASRSLWSYPKDAYKLYKSSELHTKQHQKIPVWFAFPVVVLALGAIAGPKAYETMTRTMSGKPTTEAHNGPAKPSAAASAPVAPAKPADASAAAAGGVPPTNVPSVPLLAKIKPLGCISFKTRCECFDSEGERVDVEPEVCADGASRVGYLITPRAATPRPATPVPAAARTTTSGSEAAASLGTADGSAAGGVIVHKFARGAS